MTDEMLKAMMADRLGPEICKSKDDIWDPTLDADQGEMVLEHLNVPYTINKRFVGDDNFEVAVYECTINSCHDYLGQSQDKAMAIFECLKLWYEAKGL